MVSTSGKTNCCLIVCWNMYFRRHSFDFFNAIASDYHFITKSEQVLRLFFVLFFNLIYLDNV